MAIKCEIQIDRATMRQADELLAQLEANARGPAVNQALRSVGAGIAQRTKALLPKPGYERHTRPTGMPYHDKKDEKPLGQTTITKIVQYAGGMVKVAIVGYAWPAGAHGHLVEEGHDLVKGGSKKKGGRVIGHVEPAQYMVRVVEETKAQQQSDFISGIRKALKLK